MRKKIIAGNWKMNGTVTESTILVEAIKEAISSQKEKLSCDIVVCPPFTALSTVSDLLDGSSIQLGAQNMHAIDKGAFTGEISPPMLTELGCTYVIIGHSERREYAQESDRDIHAKIKAAFHYGMTPILCVGESLEQREKNVTLSWIKNQLTSALNDLSSDEVSKMIIAYEPIWAIGTGMTATAEQAEEVCSSIRNMIKTMFDDEVASSVRIQYGGSVKGDNAKALLHKPNIDGALVGGASLDVDEFMNIILSI